MLWYSNESEPHTYKHYDYIGTHSLVYIIKPKLYITDVTKCYSKFKKMVLINEYENQGILILLAVR